MKLSIFLATLLACVACQPPRPEGAYYPDAALDMTSAVLDAGRNEDAPYVMPTLLGGGGTPGANAGGQAGGDAGGTAGGIAGGGADAGANIGVDAAVAADPEYERLKQLAGYYLMRMDMMSEATVNSGLGNITTSNRVSHLLVTQLEVDPAGPQLVGAERLCYQTFKSRCEKNSCTSLTTTMGKQVTDQLIGLQASSRNYSVTKGGLEFTAAKQTMYLGFDATSNPSLPSGDTDSRVWDTVPGGVREGLLLNLNLVAFPSVNCDVYTVQKFVSEFSGTLQGSVDAPSLEHASGSDGFDLGTAGGDGRTVGSNDPTCADGGGGGSSTEGQQMVHFKRYTPDDVDAFWKCPDASLWDALTPPAP